MARRSHGTNHLELISNLKGNGVIKTSRVEDAMKAVDRGDFCTTGPYQDAPQRLTGFDVTISAPHMHAHALENLSDTLKEGNTALDIGSGSGYLTTCLALMVGKSGRVVGIDRIADLRPVAEVNVGKNHKGLLDSARIRFITGDGTNGYKRAGPYDAIHVGAAATVVPTGLVEQLKSGGRMFIPVGPEGKDQVMLQVDKLQNGEIRTRSLFGVRYGPLKSGIQESDSNPNLPQRATSSKPVKVQKDVKDDDDNGNIPDQLKCPICLNIPYAEIYQCKNGHTICKDCEANVKHCPQCRIPIPVNGDLIRNRALESLLDNVKITCPNREKGCSAEKILKNNMKEHLSNCDAGSKSIQLCRKLFPKGSCTFWTNALTSTTSVNHFMSAHKGSLVNGTSVQIRIDMKNVMRPTLLRMDSNAVWEPVLLTNKGREHFMILTFYNQDDRSISWTCVNLDSYEENVEQYEVEFSVRNFSENVPNLKWKVAPLSVINCGEFASDPVFRVPVRILKKSYVGSVALNLELSVNINPPGVQSKHASKSVTITELTSC